MSYQEIVKKYLEALERSHYNSIVELFTQDGVVDSPLYGKKKASQFYKELFKDTSTSKITLLDIFENESSAAGYFHYDWRLKDGTLVNFDCVDIFKLTEGKIHYLRIVYDTYNKQRAKFGRVFDLFDANGDGSLTHQEITDALEVLGGGISQRDRTTLLGRINDAGVVTKSSFIEWMESREDQNIVAELRQVFEVIDIDRSGKLSIEEFTQIIRCFNTTISDAELEAFVRNADLNGDREIDFEEFMATQVYGSEFKITSAALGSFKNRGTPMH